MHAIKLYFAAHRAGVTIMFPHYHLSPAVMIYRVWELAAPAKKTTDLFKIIVIIVDNYYFTVYQFRRHLLSYASIVLTMPGPLCGPSCIPIFTIRITLKATTPNRCTNIITVWKMSLCSQTTPIFTVNQSINQSTLNETALDLSAAQI